MMALEPYGDWLVCTVPPEEGKEGVTQGGIVLPANIVNPNAPWQGDVIETGPGAKTEDQTDDIPMRSHIGDRVVFSRFVALEVIVNGRLYRVVRDRDVIMRVKPVPDQVVVIEKTPQGGDPENN